MSNAGKRVSKIEVNEGKDQLLISKTGPGMYKIEGLSSMKPDHNVIVYDLDGCTSNAENLDFTSDFFDCFNSSVRIKVGQCVFTDTHVEGPSLEAIRQAAKELLVCSMDQQDI